MYAPHSARREELYELLLAPDNHDDDLRQLIETELFQAEGEGAQVYPCEARALCPCGFAECLPGNCEAL